MCRMGNKKPARGKYPHNTSGLHADPWVFQYGTRILKLTTLFNSQYEL